MGDSAGSVGVPGVDPGSLFGDLDFPSLEDLVKSNTEVDGYESGNSDDFRQDFPRLNNHPALNFDYHNIDKFNSLSKKIQNNKNSLKVCHFNVRGIDRNYDNILLYLKSLDDPFDVICLSECHILQGKSEIDNRYDMTGYDKHIVYSTIKFGGCMIYSKSTLNAKPVKSLTKSTTTCDYLYINIPKSKNSKGTLIGCYYRHCLSNKSDIINFLNDFEISLDSNITRRSKLILTGDMNIDLCKINHNNDVATYFNCLLANNLESHILKPTRVQYYPNSLQVKSATLIDHIASNLMEYVCYSGNLFYSNSDHFGNFVIFENFFNQSRKRKDLNPQLKRYLNKIDDNKLRNDINSLDWLGNVCNDNLDLNSCSRNLITNIQDLCNTHAPKISGSKRKMKYFDKPWIDSELLSLIKIKNNLYQDKVKSPTENNEDKFRSARTRVNNQLRKKKKEYLTKYFNEHRTNAKRTWEGLYMALDISRNKKTVFTNIKDVKSDTIYSDPTEVSNKFAEYFKSVPEKVREKITTDKPDFTKYMNKPVSHSIFLEETSPIEVFNLIQKLKNSCSTGNMDVPNQFLKMISFPLSYMLSYLINRSLNSGEMPRAFKIGKQTPVFKNGNNCFSNYRPITVVNSFAKITEKVVGKRVVSYLDKFEILNSKQFGFRKNHSTIHAMINLFDTCLEGLESRLTVGGLFLDISKAFDCVDHDILLQKLDRYGIRGKMLDWFKSYLSERELFVSIDGKSSDKYTLKYGVPQGSVLGPILFLIYINDVTNSSDKFDFSMFADDTAAIIKIDHKNYDITIKDELLKVMKWFDNNLLLLNVDKTKYLYFGPYNNSIKALHDCVPEFLFKKKLDIDPPITEHSEVKYLGVIFDNKLNFSKQINSITMKINRMVGMLWKSRDLPREAKLMIYHSLVASYLNYGILIWGSSLALNLTGKFDLKHVPCQLHNVNVAHNKIIRAITCSKRYDKETKTITHTAPLLKQLNLLSLNDIYYSQLALFAYDCLVTDNLPDMFNNYLKNVENAYNSRTNPLNVQISRVELSASFRTIKIAAGYIWNLLPIDIRSTNYSKNVFKSKLKSWLISKYNMINE